MLFTERENTALDIAQMLNGLPYSQAKEILNLAHEKILSALKVSLSEDDLKSQTTKTKEFLDNYFATDPTNPANHAQNSKPCL